MEHREDFSEFLVLLLIEILAGADEVRIELIVPHAANAKQRR